MALELIGWISGAMLAICGIPQAIKIIKTNDTSSLSMMFLVLWFLGEVFGIIYVLPKEHSPLIFNYGFNTLLSGFMLFYKIKNDIINKS